MPSQTPSADELAAERPGLILTAIGPDRPGLVNSIAGFVRRAGGNMEDTRMAKLGGEFAVLVFVTGTKLALETLEDDRSAIEAELDLTCFFKRTSRVSNPTGRHYSLEVSAMDRPGIVEGISEVLSRRNINVASLTSRVVHAPLSGSPLFQLHADLQVPDAVNIAEFRRELDEVCERENLDHSLMLGRS